MKKVRKNKEKEISSEFTILSTNCNMHKKADIGSGSIQNIIFFYLMMFYNIMFLMRHMCTGNV
jgi:hypothetical protein